MIWYGRYDGGMVVLVWYGMVPYHTRNIYIRRLLVPSNDNNNGNYTSATALKARQKRPQNCPKERNAERLGRERRKLLPPKSDSVESFFVIASGIRLGIFAIGKII